MKTAIERSSDPTVYPAEDHMGETAWHRAVCLLLWQLAERWAKQRKLRAYVGSSQFVYWRKHEPTRNVAPDLYVLPGVDPGPEGLEVVKTWEHGVPSLLVEIVSTEWRKDYEHAPIACEEMGAQELVVFDSKAPRKRQPERVRWQVFRRVGRRGLVRVEATNGDRVYSKVLGAWLREVGAGGTLRVRIGSGERGDELVPSADEVLEAVAAERDAAAAERDAAAAERDAERARRERLEAELARLRGRRPRKR